ncbi:glycosyl hydrolase family 57 [Candidatus Omnitrophota bacterium]
MGSNVSDIIGELPEICAGAPNKEKSPDRGKDKYSYGTNIRPEKVRSAFGIALHMHQPTIPAATDDLQSAALISNLQHMMEHQHIGDNHNAPVFLRCYSRISDFIRELAAEGKNPRVMLDYSGCLLWGLKQMGEGAVLENLKLITSDDKYHIYCEWLGTMWSHAVVSSTPVPDIRLQITAWREHFASMFGRDALRRVRGFSPPEMHLPIHPDICYEYVKALKECGYEWIMVQEHTIENLDGSGIRRPHFPHKLIAKNSLGKTEEITALVKTQGSDTKLVAQMQPYYEALSRGREDFGGKQIPPYVLQIADGENGGVMMNEFPPMYMRVSREIGTEGVCAMNGSEYLDLIKAAGVSEGRYIRVQPVSQSRIWDKVTGFARGACDRAIDKIKADDRGFDLEKGSWTNDRDWVKGYKGILDPMNNLSVLLHKKYDSPNADKKASEYRKALLHLLISQTSCFRYWGQGLWTDYAKEICRRGEALLRQE